MTNVEVSFPDSLLAALRKAPHEVAQEVRVAASIHWYQQHAISMERAAEFAGMFSWSRRRIYHENCAMPETLVINARRLDLLRSQGATRFLVPSAARGMLCRSS